MERDSNDDTHRLLHSEPAPTSEGKVRVEEVSVDIGEDMEKDNAKENVSYLEMLNKTHTHAHTHTHNVYQA